MWSALRTERPPAEATHSCSRQQCRWPEQSFPDPYHQPAANGPLWTLQNWHISKHHIIFAFMHFMHLADTFIQSDLHWIQSLCVYQFTHFLEIEPMTFNIKPFHSLLTNRSQQVRVNRTLSESMIISTGAPQGCVSSPVLFTLYTNECTCSTVNNVNNCYMIKFSDDTAILGLISGTSDVVTYKHEVQNFVQWCDEHFLVWPQIHWRPLTSGH